MPSITQQIIVRAWRMKGEQDRIHYIAKRADGQDRHLVAKSDSALYKVLDEHLLAIGYTGPHSDGEES
jgi:hypothetical protein